MEQSIFLRTMESFPGSDIARKQSSKMIDARDKSAHLQDCFECLSLQKSAA